MTAIPATMPNALKRHIPSEFDDADTENIDPLVLSTPSKKARGFDFQLTNSEVKPLFTLPPLKKPAQYIERPQAAGHKRKVDDTATSDSCDGASKYQRVAPSSAPAGRSPKGKKIGILSRRRMTSSAFTRINPPTFSTGESQPSQPFSIDAALAGTVPTLKAKSSNRSKGWNFEIHEDTPDEELTNVMEHSTSTLDISDDEESSTSKGDRDNKENIPPVDGPAAMHLPSTQLAATRRDMMTDEPRTPLGDLVAQDFYATGCDATSVILISAEDTDENVNEKTVAASDSEEYCSPSGPQAVALTEGHEHWNDIVAQFAAEHTTVYSKDDVTNDQENPKPEAPQIQIWESESANGDDDVATKEQEIVDATTLSVLA